MLDYRLNSPLVAVRLHAKPDQRTIFTIPNGTTITILSGLDNNGLVQTTFQGEAIAVFQRDLDDRARQVFSDGAVRRRA